MKPILLLLLALASTALAERHKDLEQRIPTRAQQRIEILGFSGANIQVKSWTSNEVAVKLRLSISSSDDAYEEEFISSAVITVTESPDAIRLRFDAKDREGKLGWSILSWFKRFYVEKEIVGEIYVPQSNPLTTDMKYGTLSLTDMGGELNLLGSTNVLTLRNCSSVQRVENNYGQTTVENSGGEMMLTGASSTITIGRFAGRVDVEANYSTVNASNVTKGVRISDQSGTVTLEEIGGPVNLKANYATVTVKGVRGFVDISSASATIRVADVEGILVDANYSSVAISDVKAVAGKSIVVRGRSGSLSLEDAADSVEIDNPYSTITLRNVRGTFDIATKSATIIGDDLVGDWHSRTEYCTVKLRKLTARSVIMTNRSNAIDVRLATVPSKVDIVNEYGDVSVRMPAGFSGAVELDAAYGSIDTNLPLKSKERSGSKFSSGRVGSGNGSIMIETKSAGIELIEEGNRPDSGG